MKLPVRSFFGDRRAGRWILLGCLAVACEVSGSSAFHNKSAGSPNTDFVLTVLHNNDGESQLVDLGAGSREFGGVARFKTVVDRLKREATLGPHLKDEKGIARGVVMVSSGDNSLAAPEFNASLNKGVPYFDTMAMDLIGYDAIAIGNHDFDFGPDVLANFIEGYKKTSPPYLSANLDYSGEARLQALFDAGRIARSIVVKTQGESIGIIGAITPNLPFISSPRNVAVSRSLAGSVQSEVNKLETKGIDKIVLISHLQSIREDVELAGRLDGVDVIVAGGGNEVLANPGDLLIPGDDSEIIGPYPLIAKDIDGTEVPVVTTTGRYGYVGRLVVHFDKDGKLILIDENSGPVRVAGGVNPDAVRPDAEVQSLVVDPVVAALKALASKKIGVSEIDLDGRKSAVRSSETNLGDLVVDALFWQAHKLASRYGVSEPDIAIQNGGGIRNNGVIPAGPICELDTSDILPFPNFLVILENIPRSQIKEILENAVACTQPDDSLANPNCGSGRFAQVSGMQFEWSESGIGQIFDSDGEVLRSGTRIRQAELKDGTAIVKDGLVVPGPDLTVATIDFLARGGDRYPFRGARFTKLGVKYQQALSNYIQFALDGVISAAFYPIGGEDRITKVP